MKRIFLIGAIGLLVLAAAFMLNLALNPGSPPEPVVSTAPDKNTRPTPQVPPVVVAPLAPTPMAVPSQLAEPTAPQAAPAFDIVRVNRDGDAVIAGRAAPDAAVTVKDGDDVVGTVEADRHGEWVLVPDKPLPSGSRELSVVAEGKDGSVRESDSVVVLAVPRRDSPASPGMDRPPTGALAVVVPRDGVAPSHVLQRPPEAAQAVPDAELPTAATPDGHGTRAEAPDPVEPPGPSELAALVPPSAGQTPATPTTGHVRPPAPPAGPAELAVDSIDYDEAGRVALSGRAKPKATVEVYLDDRSIGSAEANEAGQWTMTPRSDVAPGTYTLRADELGASGRVVARIRLPFARVDALRELPPGASVVVQPGNSLWRIARRTYGEGVRYTVIYQANQTKIADPDLIYPGQIFSLPSFN